MNHFCPFWLVLKINTSRKAKCDVKEPKLLCQKRFLWGYDNIKQPTKLIFMPSTLGLPWKFMRKVCRFNITWFVKFRESPFNIS